jgi:lambda family phage portal protein
MSDQNAALQIEFSERPGEPGASSSETPKQFAGNGGAFEGAERNTRELMTFRAPNQSADRELLADKSTIDARSRHMVRNNGPVSGAVSIHRDSIVGAQFRLNSKPDHLVLGLDAVWADEFQREVEAKFTLYAESLDCWIDAARTNTLTNLIRLAVANFVPTGEVLASVEWLKGSLRPYRTAIQMIDVERLSNPNGAADSKILRRGVERDNMGAPIAYYIRNSHPVDVDSSEFTWKRVPRFKPWGRLQMIHIIEQMRPEQTRGVAEMVSVLKQMRMTQSFQDIVLQNAIVSASFAAAIESELPPHEAFAALGAGTGDDDPRFAYIKRYLGALTEYGDASKNMMIDGVKIPHLFPGTKLNLLPMGQPGGLGDSFEESLLRHTAAGLGLSYEQFSRDYSKTNYSSARASGNETWKYMQGRKKTVADRFATSIFALWLEEAINMGEIKSMPSNPPSFYDGLNKDAYCRCTWIGASRGQVDEMKETQAAVLKIRAGLSTREAECARLGNDFREIFDQLEREEALAKEKGLVFETSPTKPGTNSAQRAGSNENDDADAADSNTNDSED